MEKVGLSNPAVPHPGTSDVDNVSKTLRSAQNGAIPSADIDKLSATLAGIKDLPTLPTPAETLSVESLLKTVTNKQSQLFLSGGIEDIQEQSKRMEELYAEKSEKIRENIEKIAEQKKCQEAQKGLKIVAAVCGFFAGLAMLFCGNPVGVVAGVVAMGAAINSTVEVATDGEHGLSHLFNEIGEAIGYSEEEAAKNTQWVMMSLGILAMLATIGAGGYTVLKGAAETVNMFASGTGLVSSALESSFNIANAGVGISKSEIDYDLAKLEAEKIDIHSFMSRLHDMMEMNQEFLEKDVQNVTEVFDKASKIIANCAEASTAVMTAAPTIA